MFNSLTVISGDYPAEGHIKMVFVQQLVDQMIEQGVSVSVVAPQSVAHALIRHQKLMPRHSIMTTLSGKKYHIFRPYTITFGKSDRVKWLSRWFNNMSVMAIAKRCNGQILYAHFWSSALFVYKYALKTSIPLFIACGEGDDALENMSLNLSKYEKEQLKKAVTGVISVSSENRRKCIEFNLVAKDYIDVIPNCVDTTVFHRIDSAQLKQKLGIVAGDFVIAFVGGFIPRKGPDRVAKAITKLDDPHIKVLFIGSPFVGYNYDFDCPGIIYKGPIMHELLPQYLSCADVFVMPTQKEGCSNAIVEALAMGLPVISSDGPFNDDILDENNSIRLDPDDIDAIASAIKKLKEDFMLRNHMSEYSMSRHGEYSLEGRVKRIIKFINKRLNFS